MVVTEHSSPIRNVVDDKFEALAPVSRGEESDTEVTRHCHGAGMIGAERGATGGQGLLEQRHGFVVAARFEHLGSGFIARRGLPRHGLHHWWQLGCAACLMVGPRLIVISRSHRPSNPLSRRS